MSPPTVMTVDASGRLLIPKELCDALPWIHGADEITVWLLMEGFGRCRVVHPQDLEENDDSAELIRRAAAADVPMGPLEFDTQPQAVLGYRVIETRVTHSEAKGRSSWRLRLPSALIALWQVQPPRNQVMVRIWAGYLELWQLDALKWSHNPPLSDFV